MARTSDAPRAHETMRDITRVLLTSGNERVSDDGQLDERRRLSRPEHTLRGRAEVGVLRGVDVRHECLRVAVDEREPGALDLHANPVSLEKTVILRVHVDPRP